MVPAPDLAKDVTLVRRALDEHALVLVQDPKWPSVATLIAGGAIQGSWWGHPAGKRIFAALSAIDDDIVFAKLLSKKVTLVHDRLVPALCAIGAACAPWQLAKLDAGAKKLLAQVEAKGPLRTTGKAAKALEERLLMHTHQVHTESGAHALEASAWSALVRSRRVKLPPLDAATRAFDDLVRQGNERHGSAVTLPWPPGARAG